MIVRRNFRQIPAAEDVPAHFEWEEWQMTEEQFEMYQEGLATAEVTNIAFVTLAEAGDLDDTTAMEHMDVFERWVVGVAYTVGQLRAYEDRLYRCVQAHTSQADWAPDATPALWKLAGDPAEEWPEWSQPIGAHDAYAQGDKVTHQGKHWVSDCGGNVWEPGVAMWTLQA